MASRHNVAPRRAAGSAAAQGAAAYDGLWHASVSRTAQLLWGAVLCLAAILLLLALVSFSAADASLTTAADGDPANWLGRPGALVASVALVSTGWASLLLVPMLWLTGWRRIFLPKTPLVRRWWVGLFGVALVAIALAIWENLPAGDLTAGRGGIIGYGVELLVDRLVGGMGANAALASRAVAALVTGLGGGALWWRSLNLAAWRFALPTLGGDTNDAPFIADADTPTPAPAPSPGLRERILPRRPVKPVDSKDAPIIADAGPQPAASRNAARIEQGEMFAHASLPPLSLLTPASDKNVVPVDKVALEANARLLETVLKDFSVQGKIVAVRQGPVVTMYELEPAPGTKASRVINLAHDIARNMSAMSARVSAIPGRTVIGIELPNQQREPVVLHQLLASDAFQAQQGQLPLILGKNIAGDPVITDLAPMPHLLIAGTTGSGKSVGLNAMILSLLYRLTPDECRFILIDPKLLELSVYDGIPHLLSPVVTEPAKAVRALKWAVAQMDDRYMRMNAIHVRNITGYNDKVRAARAAGKSLRRQVHTDYDPDSGRPIFEEETLDTEPMPHIVIIVDELADLMLSAGKEVEVLIQRLSQKARAAGIHLILATQRPSVDVITGVIKSNLPTRISFHVTSKIDSRTILTEQGAEQLLGRGDMLYMMGSSPLLRIHGPFVSDDEVRAVADHWRAQGQPAYVDAVTEDAVDDGYAFGDDMAADSPEMRQFKQAVQVAIDAQRISTSSIQRALRIGYNSAARHIDKMDELGIITPPNHLGRREVLVDRNGRMGDGRHWTELL